VATAVPTGPATIIKRGDFNGRYAWRVRFSLLVIYQSSQMRTNQELVIEAMVIRQPEFVNLSGLGMRQIIAVGGGI
jgi:intracellular multiplication protein IcmL